MAVPIGSRLQLSPLCESPALLAAPPQAGPAVPSMAVVDVGYCTPNKVTLKAVGDITSLSGADFKVTELHSGRVWFRLDASAFTLDDSRVLLDASGRAACGLHRKLMRLSRTYHMRRGDSGERVAIIKGKLWTFKPQVDVYLDHSSSGGGDISGGGGSSGGGSNGQGSASSSRKGKKPDYCCKGNLLSKHYTIYRQLPDGQEAVIAQVAGHSQYNSGGHGFLLVDLEKQVILITAEAGEDLAFVVGLCCTVDRFCRS